MLKRLMFIFFVCCTYHTSLSAEILYERSSKFSIDCGLSNKVPPNGINSPFGILKNPSFHPGFYSAFFTVLGFLKDYETNDWGGYLVNFEEKGAFYEPSMGPNWWSYYFKPLYQEAPGAIDERIIKEEQKMLYKIRIIDHDRTEINAIIKNYIRVNDYVQDAVDSFVENYFDGYPILGVNFQKPERSYSTADTNFERYFNAINALLANPENDNARIFVSTDDEYFLNLLINTYGSRVVYRDIPRYSELGKPFYSSMTPNYERGFNEIVECLLLSKCKVIIGSKTHICIAASYFDPTVRLIDARTTKVR